MNEGTSILIERSCVSLDLGLVCYSCAMEIQDKMVRMRVAGTVPDILLLAEHPPTFTMGRFKRINQFKVSKSSLLEQGLAIHASDRGGGVIYHGPGQMVVYPILNLKRLGINVHHYVQSLEEVGLQVLETFKIKGSRKLGYPGIWVGAAKIGFIGLHVSRSISKHGLALNVDNDLRYFDYIDCCGIPEVAVTSIAGLTGSSPDVSLVKEKIIAAFNNVFNFKLGKASYVYDYREGASGLAEKAYTSQ